MFGVAVSVVLVVLLLLELPHPAAIPAVASATTAAAINRALPPILIPISPLFRGVSNLRQEHTP